MPGGQPGRSRSRSRRRSRDRRRSRSRSRSRSRGRRSVSRSISRSVSGELTAGADQLGEIKNLVTRQQEFIVDLISDHKKELEAKLQSQSRKFASRQIEKQFQINSGFKDRAGKVVAAIQKKDAGAALEEAEALVAELDRHEEDLIIADTSPHGWLAVAKVRAGTELPKDLRKKLSQVEKDLAATRPKRDGGPAKKPFRFSQHSQEPFVRRPERRVSPEEALVQAAKQIRPGQCSHCQKGLHFYRECPNFWSKVMESQEAKSKEAGN